MHYDALLLYLSEVGEGTWAQFKRAVAAVQNGEGSDKAASAARIMSVLGHAEFSWEQPARWAVCPPVLAALPRRPRPVAILCGQRPSALLEAMQKATAQSDVVIEKHPQEGGPMVIALRTSHWDTFEQLARDLGIHFAPNAAEYLAACLPPLDVLVEASPRCPQPVVPPIKSFEPQARQWIEVSQVNGSGLYQYENFYPDYRLLCNSQWRLVGKEVGVYTLLDRTVWTYIPEQQALHIPAHLLPPPLYQRALVLCSGQLASFSRMNNHWVYRAIPPAIAIALARKLRQNL